MPSREPTLVRVLAAALVLAAGVVGGCDREPPAEPPEDPASEAPYFSDTAFVGRTVAINAPVVRVITERSFEVDARAFGDDSLLVITPRGLTTVVGDRLPIRGRVEVFDYETYSREFRLAERQAYAEFVGEEFLAVADARAFRPTRYADRPGDCRRCRSPTGARPVGPSDRRRLPTWIGRLMWWPFRLGP
jgi:hypothetical protein